MATHSTDRQRGGNGRTGDLPSRVVDGVLASPVRRRLLQYLRDADEPVPVDDLAVYLAGLTIERTDTDAEETPTDRRQARAAIYQKHLLKLTETGVVAFDSRIGTVAFTGSERLAERLDEEY